MQLKLSVPEAIHLGLQKTHTRKIRALCEKERLQSVAMPGAGGRCHCRRTENAVAVPKPRSLRLPVGAVPGPLRQPGRGLGASALRRPSSATLSANCSDNCVSAETKRRARAP